MTQLLEYISTPRVLYIADRFSAGFHRAARPDLQFHGVFNMYRHVEDDDLIFFAQKTPSEARRSLSISSVFV